MGREPAWKRRNRPLGKGRGDLGEVGGVRRGDRGLLGPHLVLPGLPLCAHQPGLAVWVCRTARPESVGEREGGPQNPWKEAPTNLWPGSVAKVRCPSSELQQHPAWPSQSRGEAGRLARSGLNPEYQSASAFGAKVGWRGLLSSGESKAWPGAGWTAGAVCPRAH